MAKQKKKKKQQKDKILNYEQRKFHYLIIAPYILILLIYINYKQVCYFCAKVFSKADQLLYQPKTSFFLILFFILLFVLMIVLGVFIDNAKKSELKFKDYFSLKNNKAKKQVRKVVITSTAIILLCALSFGLASQSKYIAEDNAVISYSLFRNRQEYIRYDDVTSVEVRAEYQSGVHTARIHSGGKYVLIVTLKTDEQQFEADEFDFGNDYSKIVSFLEIFDSDKVAIDKESIREMQTYNHSKNTTLESIINTY